MELAVAVKKIIKQIGYPEITLDLFKFVLDKEFETED